MKKFIQKSLVWFIVFIMCVNGIAFIANYFLQKSHVYKSTFLVNKFKTSKSFDYFILGSSRGLTTLDSKIIDKNLNTYGVNLSTDDTDLKTHLLMLNHFFESGFKSKYCVLTVDEQHLESTPVQMKKNDYRFVPFIHKPYVKNYFIKYEKTLLKPLSNADYLPFLTYSYYNLELFYPSIFAILKPTYRNRFDEFGNYQYPHSSKKEFKQIKRDKVLRKIANPLLKEVLAIAKKNDCQVIIYIAPYQKIDIELSNLIAEEAIVFNHSNKISEAHLFYDPIHVNNEGNKKATHFFIEDFKNMTNTK